MEINSGVARELPCHRLVVCAWDQSLQITKLKLLNCTNYNKLSVDRAVKVYFLLLKPLIMHSVTARITIVC